ncbi:MAG: hypothetical protein AB1629_03205 [Candidatus Omnitrophota bacterium]
MDRTIEKFLKDIVLNQSDLDKANLLTITLKKLSSCMPFLVATCLVICFSYLQFLTPTFHDPDSYYHAALSSFIKSSGLHYQFRWTQFSIMKDFFADKDILFHLTIVPFLYLFNNIVLAGKFAVIFHNIIFIVIYGFILRKYLSNFLTSLFLLLPFFSSMFLLYFLQLRSITLVNILTLLGIYALIKKKLLWVFVISLIYPLLHVSFFLFIFFAFICEILRYVFHREFIIRNIYIAIIASCLGCLLHPNFPNNLIYIKLNSLIVPWYYLKDVEINFGTEVFSFPTKLVVMENFLLFLALNIFLWSSSLGKKIKFPTAVWLACFNFYLILAFFSSRYWYPANALCFIFFASYLNDLRESRNLNNFVAKANLFTSLLLLSAILVLPSNFKKICETLERNIKVCINYENAASYMRRNIPSGQTIYHAKWSDAPFFICLNPKNNYLVVCDPIYMSYYFPRIFTIYNNLQIGKLEKPYEVLDRIFKVSYGFTRRDHLIYPQVKNDPRHFKVLYENEIGIIFKIIKHS